MRHAPGMARTGATTAALGWLACTGTPRVAHPVSREVLAAERQRRDVQSMRRPLERAAIEFGGAFARDGAEALLRLRLSPEDVRGLYTENAQQRINRMSPGISPSPGERRWEMFRVLSRAPVVGFCARGARSVEPNGPEGLRMRAFMVDRLLIVGGESDGLWGAWIEGVVLTDEGWRLLPTVPFDRQVETPRRDHTDVQLWDCDLGLRPGER